MRAEGDAQRAGAHACLVYGEEWRPGGARGAGGERRAPFLNLLISSLHFSPFQVPDVQQFMADYNMQCPMAAKRLIYSGLPATVEHGKPR